MNDPATRSRTRELAPRCAWRWCALLVCALATVATTVISPAPRAAAAVPCTVIPATMTAPACVVLRSDEAEQPDPKAGLWGRIDCALESRHTFVASGGDSSPAGNALPQNDTSHRSLTLFDKDNVFGERCELGRNEHRYGENTGAQTSGTFALYRDGQHRITFFSQRYRGVSLTDPRWQTVMQMKQTQPSDAGGGIPMLELQLRGGQLHLDTPTEAKWSTAAPPANTWIRYAVDVVYSPSAVLGSVQVYVDKNGDGDALDTGEMSPSINVPTLKRESAGTTTDGVAEGDAIPSHLRLGLYHDPGYACPKPSGCTVDIDNVQVLGP